MLLNDFYTIDEWNPAEPAGAGVAPAAPSATARERRAVLVLNAAHEIFAGHFPGQPVVPGACGLQMVQELLSHALGSEYRLVKADQLKFLTPIDPRQYPRIEAAVRYTPASTTAPGTANSAGTPDRSAAPDVPVEFDASAKFAVPAASAAPLQVTAVLSAGDTIFLKFSGTFRAG